MDDVLGARVQVHVRIDLRLLRRVKSLGFALNPALIHSLEEPSHNDGDCFRYGWQDRTDGHSLDDLTADNGVPHIRIIIKGTAKERGARELATRKVGVDEEQKDRRVEELADEYTVRNLGQLLRVRIVPNPRYQVDRLSLDHNIDDHDDDCDGIRSH